MLLNISPLKRAAISTLLGLVVIIFSYQIFQSFLLASVMGWIGFSMLYLIFCWVVICKRSIQQIKERANQDDGSRIFVSIIIILSSLASFFAVFLLTISKSEQLPQVYVIPVAIISMLSAWTLVHTQYTFHYAYKYYDEDNAKNKGLKYPDDEEPNYYDFAYFSFCMGSTYQVSDVSVSNKPMRKIVMWHGLLAFFMNTFVVALTINLIAGIN